MIEIFEKKVQSHILFYSLFVISIISIITDVLTSSSSIQPIMYIIPLVIVCLVHIYITFVVIDDEIINKTKYDFKENLTNVFIIIGICLIISIIIAFFTAYAKSYDFILADILNGEFKRAFSNYYYYNTFGNYLKYSIIMYAILILSRNIKPMDIGIIKT